MWLDDIVARIKRTEDSDTATVGQAYQALDYYERDGLRMARVLRELGEYARLNEIALLDNGLTLLHANRINLSDDAKELLHDTRILKQEAEDEA